MPTTTNESWEGYPNKTRQTVVFNDIKTTKYRDCSAINYAVSYKYDIRAYLPGVWGTGRMWSYSSWQYVTIRPELNGGLNSSKVDLNWDWNGFTSSELYYWSRPVRIYRNNSLIHTGNSINSYTDLSPVSGINRYRICCQGDDYDSSLYPTACSNVLTIDVP